MKADYGMLREQRSAAKPKAEVPKCLVVGLSEPLSADAGFAATAGYCLGILPAIPLI